MAMILCIILISVKPQSLICDLVHYYCNSIDNLKNYKIGFIFLKVLSLGGKNSHKL